MQSTGKQNITSYEKVPNWHCASVVQLSQYNLSENENVNVEVGDTYCSHSEVGPAV